MIRICGGSFKGRKLKKVPDRVVRPMPDKLKEALFNVIHPALKDTTCLDGFAGTGSVGLEALSRGAAEVVFIDEYYPAVKVINHNIKRCGVEEKAKVIRKEFNRGVIQLSKEGKKFDFIFLDPPYKLLEKRNPLRVIMKRKILNENGLIILRQHKKISFNQKYFQVEKRLAMGDDIVNFYKNKIEQ